MKICVVGAGAIGGLLAAKFALAGEAVTVVDQGSHLAAIQERGLTLIWEDGSEAIAQVKAVGTISEIEGPQDLVVLAVKAHFLDQVARDVETVCGPDTMFLTVQNGMPWWYFHKQGGPFEGTRLKSLDPSGLLSRHIDCDRVIGCVVYPAATVPEAGVIRHVEGDRFPIGELDGSQSARVQMLYDLLIKSGFRSRILEDIRAEVWLKAWGNMSFNPISALTHATLVEICQFPETRALARRMMEEAQAVAETLGITFRHTIDKRIEGAEGVGAHKTSMLQDVEAGRSLETEALIGAVLELAALTETPAPSLQAIYACVKLLNRKIVLDRSGVRMVVAA